MREKRRRFTDVPRGRMTERARRFTDAHSERRSVRAGARRHAVNDAADRRGRSRGLTRTRGRFEAGDGTLQRIGV